jgi:hypothetical protein
MKLLRAALVPLVGVVLASPSVCRAQSIQSPYRFVDKTQAVSAFAGYVATGKGSVGLGPKSGPLFGTRYSIRLSGPFNVEIEPAFFKSTRPVRDTTVVDSARQIVGEADIALLVVNGALRFNITGPRTWNRLQPFLLFGGGAAVDLSGSSPDDELVTGEARFDFGTSFAGAIGGGVEWFASDRLTVRFDARNALWKIKTPLAFLADDFGANTPGEEWVQNGWFTVGFSLRF